MYGYPTLLLTPFDLVRDLSVMGRRVSVNELILASAAVVP